jgi:undecaprenyl pyrophosphate phosphatase UppP
MITHRRRRVLAESTLATVVIAVLAVLLYDLTVGGVNRPLVVGIAVVMALIIGPLIGLWIEGPIEDGELDEAAQRRSPSRR